MPSLQNQRYPSPDGMFSRGDFIYDAERDVYVRGEEAIYEMRRLQV
jgi:hypothetical protein